MTPLLYGSQHFQIRSHSWGVRSLNVELLNGWVASSLQVTTPSYSRCCKSVFPQRTQYRYVGQS